jgi:signal transduction histidine kinase/CheY-like chemotaxis protein
MATQRSAAVDDLSYLRQESLRVVMVCLTVGAYLWGVVLFVGHNRFGPWWWGPIILAVGVAISFVIRYRHLPLAAGVTILGVATVAIRDVWSAGLDVGPYLLAVVVGLTGLLFSMRHVVRVTVLCIGSVVVIGLARWGHSPFSADVLAPVLVIGAVGTLSSLAVRNLYEALDWFQERAMSAQRNEEELRKRQGQLARTLKALDEAYQRLEHLNFDLARARETAEEARLVKQQFVTRVSHELRTPLNVIVALSEIMYLSPERYGGGPLPRDLRGDVYEIYRSGKHLVRLIGDVLDMSQIEARRMRIDLQPVALHGLVAEALDMIRPLVQEKGLALRNELPADLPPVLIDRTRVQQVLLNLLNNARRFTEWGSITVQAALEADQVRVTVADTGVGIPPGEHESMFKEFHQIKSPDSGDRNGSGLGLAISKSFIEMHGGRIWVESDGVPGEGSRFHFTLPVAGVESVGVSALQGTRKLPKPPTGRGRTLLLLGRDATIVRMLEQRFDDYQVVPVDDVSEVRDLIDRLHARAVVVTPARTGAAERRVQELRQVLAPSSVPVILCPLLGERQLGQALGASDYLVKPVSRETLTVLLDRLGEGVRRILVVDDDYRMVHLLARMLQMDEREYEVTRAHDGKEGLREMRARRPDLVLLDLVMPEMDGYEVLAQMQADAELRDIPVVVITAQAPTPDEERRLGGKMLCLSTGAGFTNEEALTYLGGLLDVVGLSLPLGRAGEIVQNG